MPTATYNKFDSFVEALAEKVHNLGADTIKVALSNVAPVATNTVLANITEIAYTNLLNNPTSREFTASASSQTSGTYTLDFADFTLEAVTGALPTFRYVVFYNDTATSDELIAWFDYGVGGVDLAVGEQLDIVFNASGFFTLA